MSIPSIKRLASTTNNKATSFGFLLSRISIGMTMFHFTSGYAPALATHPTLSFAVLTIRIFSVIIMLGLFSRPAALIIIVITLMYNALLFPIHGDPIHPWQEEMILYYGLLCAHSLCRSWPLQPGCSPF